MGRGNRYQGQSAKRLLYGPRQATLRSAASGYLTATHLGRQLAAGKVPWEIENNFGSVFFARDGETVDFDDQTAHICYPSNLTNQPLVLSIVEDQDQSILSLSYSAVTEAYRPATPASYRERKFLATLADQLIDKNVVVDLCPINQGQIEDIFANYPVRRFNFTADLNEVEQSQDQHIADLANCAALNVDQYQALSRCGSLMEIWSDEDSREAFLKASFGREVYLRTPLQTFAEIDH